MDYFAKVSTVNDLWPWFANSCRFFSFRNTWSGMNSWIMVTKIAPVYSSTQQFALRGIIEKRAFRFLKFSWQPLNVLSRVHKRGGIHFFQADGWFWSFFSITLDALSCTQCIKWEKLPVIIHRVPPMQTQKFLSFSIIFLIFETCKSFS